METMHKELTGFLSSREITAQRDELLEALEGLIDEHLNGINSLEDESLMEEGEYEAELDKNVRACALIAKVKGE